MRHASCMVLQRVAKVYPTMKPVLLGMNSKTGEALALLPNTGAGARLFEMSGMSKKAYIEAFERINLLDDPVWDPGMGKYSARKMRERMKGRKIIVLGTQAWTALGLPKANWFEKKIDVDDTEWYLIPHPSGKNLLYNKPAIRAKTTALIQSVIK